ncbi:MAG TPA: hypothetical protein VMV46_16215 [Thermoanaerobaculia bacterium]|nr:hypothetical protein [Thermoanaerobaculia bacterium]
MFSLPARATLCSVFLLASFLLVSVVAPGFAGNRWIEGTVSTDLREVLRDDRRDRIYVSDVGASRILVLDSRSETVVARVAVPPTLNDIALSRDGTYLLAGTTHAFVRLHLDDLTAETIPLPVAYPHTVQALAVEASGLVVALGWGTRAYVIDLDREEVLHAFGWERFGWDFPISMIETDATGTVVWIVSTHLNPSSLFGFDLSDPLRPRELGRGDRTVGSFMRDFEPAPHRPELYLSPGHPYGIQVFDTLALTEVALLPGVLGSPALAVDRSGEHVFCAVGSVHAEDRILHYGVESRALLLEYPLEGRAPNDLTRLRGLAVDRRGRKLFVAHGNDSQWSPRSQIQVVDVGHRVGLDVRPRTPSNLVHVGSNAILPVAILTSAELDATRVDPSTLALGPGEAPALLGRGGAFDVDGDGMPDLVVHFRVADTGLGCDDREVAIRGLAPDGLPLHGADAIVPVGCR